MKIMKKNAKTKWNYEPSLSQLLSDPLVTSLMAADRVDPDELREELREMARGKVSSVSRASRSAGECCWL